MGVVVRGWVEIGGDGRWVEKKKVEEFIRWVERWMIGCIDRVY